jgi:hypothetical protein
MAKATNPLVTKAIIADVVIRRWTGRKLDRTITDEVNTSYDATEDAGRYNKLLLSKEAFAEIRQVVSHARTKHLVLTLPWADSGFRILPLAMYDEFASAFRKYKQEFDEAADKFDTNFERYKLSRKKELGKAFREEDYPDKARVRQMFDFKTIVRPCPNVDDFRVSLAKEQIEDITSGLREEMEAALKESLHEPLRRIVKVVGKMAVKLENYVPGDEDTEAENTFKDSLVNNVRNLIPILSAFNLSGDKELDGLIKKMDKELCAIDAPILREDADKRTKVQKAATDILKKANELMA